MSLRKVLVGVPLILGVIANQAHAEDLLGLYGKALQQDARVQIGRAEYDAALQAKPGARSPLLPQISATASYERHDQSYSDIPAARKNLYKDGSYNSRNYTVSLEQTLFNRAQWKALAQAGDVIAQATAERLRSEQDLIMRLATAYFQVLAAADGLKFTRMERQATQHQSEEMQRRFDAGLSTAVDVKESAAQLSLAKAQEIDSAYQLSVEKENLRVITGENPGNLRNLKANIRLTPLKSSMESWTKLALENSPQVMSALAALKHAEKEVERRRAAHLPTLGFNAEYADTKDDGGFSEGRDADTSLGLELKIPLYSGGKTVSDVKEAKAFLMKAKRQYDLATRETTRETRAAYLNTRAAVNRMNALKEALSATEAAYTASKSGLSIGTRTVLEVLTSLRDSLSAKKDYNQARYDYVLSLFRLKQAAGELEEKDLQTVNGWLQDF